MPLSRRARQLRLTGLLLGLLAFLAPGAWATQYYGQVFFNGLPVPGATVTVTQGGKRFSTVTDQQGLYEFSDLANGPWKIRIEMQGFATVTGTVVVVPNAPQGAWELQLLPLGKILSGIQVTTPKSVAASPTVKSRTPSPGPVLELQAKGPAESSDGLLINGSVNNAATSRFSLSPAFGNHRTGARGLYTGGFGVIAGNSFFDARPYSITGLPVRNNNYSQLTTIFTLGGPLNIPHLLYNGPDFFLGYQRTRDRYAKNEFGLAPTVARGSGDLSGLRNAAGQPLTIYDPATGQPFGGPIPVSAQARSLLNLYPAANLNGNSRYNYQNEVLSNTHVDALQARLEKSLGRRDQLYGRLAFESSRSDSVNLFNFRDTTDLLGIATDMNWSHDFPHDFLVTFGYSFSRLRTRVAPQFENRENISGAAGIGGNAQDPMDWGPPTLLFASGITSLTDANSLFNRNRTDALSINVVNSHWRHTVSFGGDVRWQEFNERGQLNPRGTFSFTGAATSAPGSAVGSTGSDLADFLLGIPDASTIAFGNADKYFRARGYDAFVSDDWRVRPELTITAGVRWEYGAPLSELFDRLVNLDVTPGFAAVAPVLANSPTGPLTGQHYPASLIRPDRHGFEPRIGIAWRPFAASTLVVRAGYGIYDDTSVYLSLAEQMAQQAPLSTSLNMANSAACPLSLADGFRNCSSSAPDTFAVDPNFRVGYAQEWELSLQRDLPGALMMIARYLGIKGTRGMQEFLPNTYPISAANPCPLCPSGFVYVTSNGNSTREAGEIELRRRLRAGFTATINYTYSKSIDDDAQLGGQGPVEAQSEYGQNPFTQSEPVAAPMIAQNWLDLSAERGLSSFDQRNLVKAQIQYTSGMGLGGGTLLSGWRGTLLKEWTVLTNITAGSGLPETPIFLANVPGTAFTGTIRADLTGAPVYESAGGAHLNAAAFRAPTPGQWGTARRNSIRGPGEFSLDAAVARTFRLRGEWNLDVRLDATNVLNHATFTGWNNIVNAATFGLPAAVHPMRSLELTGRLRF